MLLALADMAALQHGILVSHFQIAIQGGDLQSLAAVGITGTLNIQNVLSTDVLYLQLALAANADDVGLFPIDAVLLAQLVEAVGIAGLQENQSLTLQKGGFDHIFAQICAAEAVVDEILQLLGGGEEGRLHVEDVFTLLPAQNTANFAAFQQGFGSVNQFLHLKSPNLTLGPSVRTFSTKLFMVSENFTPSAAETHSTRVRPSSMPR